MVENYYPVQPGFATQSTFPATSPPLTYASPTGHLAIPRTHQIHLLHLLHLNLLFFLLRMFLLWLFACLAPIIQLSAQMPHPHRIFPHSTSIYFPILSQYPFLHCMYHHLKIFNLLFTTYLLLVGFHQKITQVAGKAFDLLCTVVSLVA